MKVFNLILVKLNTLGNGETFKLKIENDLIQFEQIATYQKKKRLIGYAEEDH